MKLHAIRATNLNSLYGDSAVDLDADLGGASLFLIVGPTGAGKSTLMDAVSLALFGSTPRLDGLRSEQAVAEQVMSRGTGAARAEVEFSKGEAVRRARYRAVWSARRARGAPDGAMQATQRSLERLDGDGAWQVLVSDHRNKFVRPVFDEALEGFSSSDFQRSMLLAQGQFDAMLHALPEERAALLERLTDTGIYQRLGERAARMHAAWKGRLDGLRARLHAISPVTDAALADARARVADGDARLAEHDRELARWIGLRTWRERDAALDVDVRRQAEALAAAEARIDAARERIDALAEHERCADAFAAADALRALDARLAAHQADRDALALAVPLREAEVERAQLAADAAGAAHRAAELALAALRGPAVAASEAARAATLATEERDGAERSVEKAEAELEAARARRAAAEAERARAEAARGSAADARDALAADAPLAAALPAIELRFAAWEALTAAWVRDRADQARRERASTEEAEALARDRAALATRREVELAPLVDAREAARTAWSALASDPDAALDAGRARLAGLATAAERLRDGLRAVVARDEAIARVGSRAAALAEIDARRAALDERIAIVEREAFAAGGIADERASTTAAIARIAALGDARAALVDGEPCPLCGSGDHPFVHDPVQRARADAIAGELAVAQEQLARAMTARDAARDALAARLRERAAEDAAHIAATREQEAATRERDAAVALARDALLATALAPDASRSDAQAALDAIESERSSVAASIAALERALEADRRSERALAEARAALADAEAALAGREAARAQARVDHVAREASLVERQDALAAEERGLRVELGRLGVDGPTAADALVAARARTAAWVSAVRGVEQTERVRDDAVAACRAADEAVDVARAAHTAAQDAARHRRIAWEHAGSAVERAREAFLAAWRAAAAIDAPDESARPADDLPVVALVRFQETRVDARARAQRAALAALADARAAASDVRARVEVLAAAADRLTAERAPIAEGLAAALAALGLEPSALDARRLGPEVLASARALRAELTEARTRASAALDAATTLRDRHRSDRPDGLDALDPDALDARIDACERERADHRAALDDARATLQIAERDRDARERAARALTEAEAHASVWLRLHALIGRGDGKRFKLFAQALNLDQLLARANEHLGRLTDRYRIVSEREPETGMPTLDLVVEDRWRPGATRSLKTLSGGESFLASLALALGLSDLRTSSMPVETLLLDEGFGALDPSTLDTALAALQQLQSTGRQVGIISHVTGLNERIDARVLVEPLGEGRSRVRTVLGGA